MGDQVQVNAAKLEELLNLSLEINTIRSFKELFERVVQRSAEILEADRASLYIYDPEKQQLWTLAAKDLEKPIYLPLNKGLAGLCAASEKVLVVEDAYQHPAFDPSWDRKHGYRTKSVLCLPIKNREGKLKGVLQIINKLNRETFSEEDVKLATYLVSLVGVALENYFLIERLKRLLENFMRTLVTTIDAKHPLTAGHSERVMEYSLYLGRKLGLPPETLELLKYASLLHDIGKLGIPDAVLTKRGPFTPEERKIMEKHSWWTRVILSRIDWPEEWKKVAYIAACHHEKMDGSGYIYGLKGEEIPFLSRIIAVADVFDALTSKRDYPKYDEQKRPIKEETFPLERAMEILKKCAGNHLDPELVEIFVSKPEELKELYARLHSSRN